jgi:hypothetical protein
MGCVILESLHNSFCFSWIMVTYLFSCCGWVVFQAVEVRILKRYWVLPVIYTIVHG